MFTMFVPEGWSGRQIGIMWVQAVSTLERKVSKAKSFPKLSKFFVYSL